MAEPEKFQRGDHVVITRRGEYDGWYGIVDTSESGDLRDVRFRGGAVVRFEVADMRLRTVEEELREANPQLRQELREPESLAAAGASFASQAGNTWEENSSEAAELARVSAAFSLAAIAGALTAPATHLDVELGDEVLQPARVPVDSDPATEPSFCENDTVVVEVAPGGVVVGRVVGVSGPVNGLYEYNVSLPAGVFKYPSSMIRSSTGKSS